MNLLHLPWWAEVPLAGIVTVLLFSAALGIFQSLKLVAYRRRLTQPRITEMAESTRVISAVVYSALDAHEPGQPTKPNEIAWEDFVRARVSSFQTARGCLSSLQLLGTAFSLLVLFSLDWQYLVIGVIVIGVTALSPLSVAARGDVHKEIGNIAIDLYAWANSDIDSFESHGTRIHPDEDALVGLIYTWIGYYRISRSS